MRFAVMLNLPSFPWHRLCYVWQHEWNGLTQTYPYDHVISVTKNVTEDGAREVVTSPGKSERFKVCIAFWGMISHPLVLYNT